MENPLDFTLQKRYRWVSGLGGKVSEFDTLIEWECFCQRRFLFPRNGGIKFPNVFSYYYSPGFSEEILR